MRRLRFLVIAATLVGCSVLTKFDIDGQPCDKNEPNPALSCLSDAGFVCVDGFCKLGALPPAGDGGADAGVDDGGTDGGNAGG